MAHFEEPIPESVRRSLDPASAAALNDLEAAHDSRMEELDRQASGAEPAAANENVPNEDEPLPEVNDRMKGLAGEKAGALVNGIIETIRTEGASRLQPEELVELVMADAIKGMGVRSKRNAEALAADPAFREIARAALQGALEEKILALGNDQETISPLMHILDRLEQA